MLKALVAVNSLLRTLALVAFVGLLGVGGWLGYDAFESRGEDQRRLVEQQKQIEKLSNELDAAQKQVARLDMALRLSKVDHRIAQIVVVDQTPAEGDERMKTTLTFVEVDNSGRKLGEPKRYTIDGDTVYIDAQVVKFKDELVESGDPLRSTSICLFKRLFGEYQQPSEGLPIDGVGSRPAAYSPGEPLSDFEKEIWDNFWEYANDPERREAAGVRTAQGEAPSIQLRKGKLYKIQLRASDGLSIVSEDLPAVLSEPVGR